MLRTNPHTALFVLGVPFLAACGDVVALPGPEVTVPAEESAGPPAPPAAGSAPDGPGHTFALSRLHLLGPGGSAGPDDWRRLGFDLDGVLTADRGTASCAPRDPSHFAAEDGAGGRDNTFGGEFLELLRSVNTNLERDTEAAIQGGDFTVLFRLAGIGEAPSYLGLSGAAFGGAPFTGSDGVRRAPTWEDEEAWPVAGESVDGSLDSPHLIFENAYLTDDGAGGTWVGHGLGELSLQLSLWGSDGTFDETFRLVIQDPVVVAPLSADRTRIVGGTLAGTVDVEDLVAESLRVAEAVVPGYCQKDAAAEFADLLRAVADIHSDRRDDPTAPCEHLSVGLGFEGSRVTLGPLMAPAEPVVNPCVP